MEQRRSWLPSPAMLVAFIALVAALTGSAVALQGKNSVKSNDIAPGAVKGKDIHTEAVKPPKLTPVTYECVCEKSTARPGRCPRHR